MEIKLTALRLQHERSSQGASSRIAKKKLPLPVSLKGKLNSRNFGPANNS